MVLEYSSYQGVYFMCCWTVWRGGKSRNLFYHSITFIVHGNCYLENTLYIFTEAVRLPNQFFSMLALAHEACKMFWSPFLAWELIVKKRSGFFFFLNTSTKQKWEFVCAFNLIGREKIIFFLWCGISIPDSLILNTVGRKTVGFVHHLISPDIEMSSPGEAAYFVSSIFH